MSPSPDEPSPAPAPRPRRRGHSSHRSRSSRRRHSGRGPAAHHAAGPPADDSRAPALLVHPATGPTRAVVLVLYGGKAASYAPSSRRHLSAARLAPVARRVARAVAADGVAVWTVRYRYRGWNGAAASPTVDARWALDQVRATHGDVPVVLLGHSMGGRTALRVAGDRSVRAVVALAPWLPIGEPVDQLAGRWVRILHGTRDRWTDPFGSLAFAERAESIGADVARVELARSGHFMLRRRAAWAGLTLACTVGALRQSGIAVPAARHDRTSTPRGTNDMYRVTAGQLRVQV